MKKYDWLKCSVEGLDGWTTLLENMFERLDEYVRENNIEGFEITHIKEKYGGLRLEGNGGDGGINDLIFELEVVSNYICQECGYTGKTRKEKRLKTLCNECYANSMEKKQ